MDRNRTWAVRGAAGVLVAVLGALLASVTAGAAAPAKTTVSVAGTLQRCEPNDGRWFRCQGGNMYVLSLGRHLRDGEPIDWAESGGIFDLRIKLAGLPEARVTITSYYRACLRRAPEAGAVDYWVGQLHTWGPMFRIAQRIATSPEAVRKGSPCVVRVY